MLRHFLQVKDLTLPEYRHLFSWVASAKGGDTSWHLQNKVVLLIFEKQSTRTRLSFEVGVKQLGGHPIFLEGRSTQLVRGESLEASARILSAISDAVVWRTTKHQILEEFSRFSSVPLLNGLSDEYHPCQVAADIFTFTECRGKISGKVVAWIGDANNMLMSWVQAAKIFGFQLRISSFNREAFLAGAENCCCFVSPLEACSQADLVVTDVWESMNYSSRDSQKVGDSPLHKKKRERWKVSEKVMSVAKAEALFFHCLPAHAGQEVSGSVIDGPKSVVYLEANNRLHFQKGLLSYFVSGSESSVKSKVPVPSLL